MPQRWWIPIFLLPFPSAPPAIVVMFIISYALWTKPCAYCSMVLCALFASSCYWYAPPDFDCLDLLPPDAPASLSTYSSSVGSKPEDPMKVAESMLAASRAMKARSVKAPPAPAVSPPPAPPSRLSQLARLVPQSVIREALDAGSWSLALLPDFAKEAMGLRDHPPLPGEDDADLIGESSDSTDGQGDQSQSPTEEQPRSSSPPAPPPQSSRTPRSFCWLKIPDTAAGWWEPQTRSCPLGRTSRSLKTPETPRWRSRFPIIPERLFLGIPNSGIGIWLRLY